MGLIIAKLAIKQYKMYRNHNALIITFIYQKHSTISTTAIPL